MPLKWKGSRHLYIGRANALIVRKENAPPVAAGRRSMFWRCNMKWTRLVLIVLLAAMTFGGSFTCKSGDDQRDHPTTTTDQASVTFTAAIA